MDQQMLIKNCVKNSLLFYSITAPGAHHDSWFAYFNHNKKERPAAVLRDGVLRRMIPRQTGDYSSIFILFYLFVEK